MAGLTYRDIGPADLATVIALLADDDLGRIRENRNPADPLYLKALAEIDADPNNRVLLVERDGEPVGTFQLTIIPSISLQAKRRLQIEAVRVRSDLRGQGIGREMMRWAIEQAKVADCALVQLTTNTARTAAKRFYEQVGFVASHNGMKLTLD
ncbi:MAG: GNAT family N-acetyltransferase [Alphaproteobacteria bacterium]|nr:GNAT family N-acetyltransferase [Alphaproteobacteria bacterium]